MYDFNGIPVRNPGFIVIPAFQNKTVSFHDKHLFAKFKVGKQIRDCPQRIRQFRPDTVHHNLQVFSLLPLIICRGLNFRTLIQSAFSTYPDLRSGRKSDQNSTSSPVCSSTIRPAIYRPVTGLSKIPLRKWPAATYRPGYSAAGPI